MSKKTEKPAADSQGPIGKHMIALRLSSTGRQLLGELSDRLGLSRTATIEFLIREKHREDFGEHTRK